MTTTINVINKAPFLRTSRSFPEDMHELCVECNKSYVELAQAVNRRTIGIFPTNSQVITGDAWYLTTKRNQTLRQVYSLTSANSFNHGINFNSVSFFTVIRGIGFDGTNYFPLPYVSSVSVTDQIGIYVTPTQVIINSGVGAPVIISGIILLEWAVN